MAVLWLQSEAGKRALERSLTQRTGVAFRLDGDLDIRFLPRVGVRAAGVVASDPVSGNELASGQVIEAELELGPLVRREPVVRRFIVEGLRVKRPDGHGLFFPRVELDSFAVNQATDFSIDWSWMGKIAGQFAWFPEASRVDLDAAWLESEWDDIGYRGQIHYQEDVITFTESELSFGSQAVEGQGCWLPGGPPSLNLVLQAGQLDLDALLQHVPGGQDAGMSLAFELNLRLEVAELRHGETVAYDTVLEYGRPPECP